MPDASPESVHAEILEDDGTFPNNQDLPVLVYGSAFEDSTLNLADEMEQTFARHNWTGAWRNGIYTYHHYHSTAHEVLGVYRGSVTVQLGGPDGITVDADAGDVLVLPAGTAHKNLGSSNAFRCIGAYPAGQDWDMNYGEESERPDADQNIQQVPVPERDPVFGREGPLIEHWNLS